MRQRKNNSYKLNETTGIAPVLKAGSSTLAYAVIQAHHPDLASMRVSYPDDGREHNRPGWQGIVPKLEDAEVVLMAVRDPEDRFASAMAQVGLTDVDDTLDRLESEGIFNPHFHKQSDRTGVALTKAYRFPEHLEDLAQEAGLEWPLEQINESPAGVKPELTEEQAERVRSFYAEDVALYDLITSPGLEIVAETPVEKVPVPTSVSQKQLRLAMLAAGIDFSQVENRIDAIGGTQAQAVRIEWEYSTQAERAHPMISAIGQQLGLTEEQIDDIFRAAAVID